MTTDHDTSQSDEPVPLLEPPFDTSRAVLRALVGSTLLGVDEFTARLRQWEQDLLNEAVDIDEDGAATEADALRHALIGLLFVTQERARRDALRLQERTQTFAQGLRETIDKMAANPFLRPIARPAKARIDALVEQIDAEVKHWIDIGVAEEARSRALSSKALDEVVSEVIAALADDPEVRDLVQQQSVGLAGEVVDAMREVTVTADSVFEGIARRMLGRKPRYKLPPRELRLLAETGQQDSDPEQS